MATSNVHRLEQNRSTHMAHMNRLETELRSQEVTITALGNYINTLAYEKTDLVLPSDILRILSQINMLQRRKSNGVTKPKTTTPRKLTSTVSSPDLGDRVSRIFRKNNLQIFSESADSETDDESLFTKSLSDTKGVASKLKEKKPLNTTQSSPNSLTRNGSLGRILTQEDIDSLKKIAQKQNDKINVIGRMSSINIEISHVDKSSNVQEDQKAIKTNQGFSSDSVNSKSNKEEAGKNEEVLSHDETTSETNPLAETKQENVPLKTRKISTGYLRRSSSANNVPPVKNESDLREAINVQTNKHPLETINDNKSSFEGTKQMKGFTPFSMKQTSALPHTNSSPNISPPPNGNRKMPESLLSSKDEKNMMNKKTDFANTEKLNSAASDLLIGRNNLLTR